MPYRIEHAKQGRAGCKNTECKHEGIKIGKGELRMGTLVTIQEHTSWTWKHWGCVTPAQIENLQQDSGGDPDMVDGYDELPPEHQEKVKYALDNGHVHDEDWKGDVECNRVGAKGFRAKAKKAPKKKKKGNSGDEGDAGAAEVEAPKSKKKRGRAAKEEDDDEETPAPVPKKARGRAKKATKEDEDPESEVEQPKVKQPARGKKAAVYKEVSDEDDEEAPKPKRGRKKATPAEADEKPAPKRAGRKKKAAAGDD